MELDLGSIVLADIEHQLRLTMDVTVTLSIPTDSDSTTSSSVQKLAFSPNTWIERGNDIWIRFHLRWERLSGGLECAGPSLLEALGGALRNSELWTHLKFQPSLSIEGSSNGAPQRGRGSIILRLQQSLGAGSDLSQAPSNRRQETSRGVPDTKAPHGIPCVRLYAVDVALDLSPTVGRSNLECIDKNCPPKCGSFEDLVGLASGLREDVENIACQSNILECGLLMSTCSPKDAILKPEPITRAIHSPIFEPLLSVEDLQQAQYSDESPFHFSIDEDEILSDYDEVDDLIDDFPLFPVMPQRGLPPEFSEVPPEHAMLECESDTSFGMLLDEKNIATRADQTASLPSELLGVPSFVPQCVLKIINSAIGLLMTGTTRRSPAEISIESNGLSTNLMSFAPAVFSLEYHRVMKSKLHLLPTISRSIFNIERRSTPLALQERTQHSKTVSLGGIEKKLLQANTIQSNSSFLLRDSIELSLWSLLEHDLRAYISDELSFQIKNAKHVLSTDERGAKANNKV